MRMKLTIGWSKPSAISSFELCTTPCMVTPDAYGTALPDNPNRPQLAEDPAAARARAVDHQRKDDRGLNARGRADGDIRARAHAARLRAAIRRGPPALIRARSFLMRWQPHRIF